MSKEEFVVSSRHFKNRKEQDLWINARLEAFGDWYIEVPKKFSKWKSYYKDNFKSALFHEFIREVRTIQGDPVAYLSSVPMYWPGDVSALPDFNYVSESFNINSRKFTIATIFYLLSSVSNVAKVMHNVFFKKLRSRRIDGANCLCLLAIVVRKKYQGKGVPRLLIKDAKLQSINLGYKYMLGPFRPSGYGAYKSRLQLAHNNKLFEEYCAMKTSDGLPFDPWLRTVVKNGAQLLKIEPQSLVIRGDLKKFEQYQNNYNPNEWYSPLPDVWECGETHTWYIDRARSIVRSVEPNYWGCFDLEANEG